MWGHEGEGGVSLAQLTNACFHSGAEIVQPPIGGVRRGSGVQDGQGCAVEVCVAAREGSSGPHAGCGGEFTPGPMSKTAGRRARKGLGVERVRRGCANDADGVEKVEV